jgi:hypothetical protein
MRAIFTMLLRLYPKSLRDQFAEEMLAVHCQAAADARAAGGWHYLRFCLREFFGILSDVTTATHLGKPSMTHFRWSILGGIAGLLIATMVVTFGDSYRSTGLLRITPTAIDERYVPTAPVTREAGFEKITESLLTRASMTNIIQTHDLYPASRRRMPMEAVIQEMKSDIEMAPSASGQAIPVAFTYPNRYLAQKVLADLMARIVTEHRRIREDEASLSVLFLTDRAEEAAKEWAEAIKKAQAGGERNARLQMDIDLARDHYRTVSDKLAQARTAKAMVGMKLGQAIEILDAASLPLSQDRNPVIVFLVGLAGGISTGLVISLLIAMIRAGRQARELTA